MAVLTIGTVVSVAFLILWGLKAESDISDELEECIEEWKTSKERWD